MKKDNQLQDAFNEYFESSKAPNQNVLNAAKNSMESPRTVSAATPVWKRALVSAACAVSALLSGAGLYFFPSTMGGIIAGIDGGNKNQADTANKQISYYGAEGLEESQVDLYGDGAPSGLNFVKKIDNTKNYSVNSLDAYSADGSLAYVKADMTAVLNGSRHDTIVYAEYTEKNSVCELFEEYYGGEKAYYRGYYFLYFDTEDNGEPVKKLTVERDGVKYYLSVTSSDSFAYRAWLDLILK
ncbi:MAG: hypothetical protein K2N14_04490 [Clostridia bacterium]|nr:hypothetical protein [Clostridia bacterium]